MPAPQDKIAHVVVLMLENRSFDHIFGFRKGVNGLQGTETNFLNPSSPASNTNPPFKVDQGQPFQTLPSQGPGHNVHDVNIQICNNIAGPSPANPGSNNGFVANFPKWLTLDHITNQTPELLHLPMQSLSPDKVPVINALADNFVLCDNWYSEVPGPTQPNRLYVHAATSMGFAHNLFKVSPKPAFGVDTIYSRLAQAGFSWTMYYHDAIDIDVFSQINQQTTNIRRFVDKFASDISSGKLANYSFIEPGMLARLDTAQRNSQHAPEDVRHGDKLIADVYNALRSNPNVWNKSLLIVTYDEHGGFYDHVVPPSSGVPNPDNLNSPRPDDPDPQRAPNFAFDRLGIRVPALIVSPWVQKGVVEHTLYQHTSILATVKKLFGLPQFLTKRDAKANPFDSLLQTSKPPRTDAPLNLLPASIPAVAVSPHDPKHPGNQPLDENQQAIVHRVYDLTQASFPAGAPAEGFPTTQHEASAFIRKRYQKHFGYA